MGWGGIGGVVPKEIPIKKSPTKKESSTTDLNSLEANPRLKDNGRRLMRDKSWTSSWGTTAHDGQGGFWRVRTGGSSGPNENRFPYRSTEPSAYLFDKSAI